MTRLATPFSPPPRPHSVVLGELAIAAGIAGQPITLLYRDFPAPVLCEIWKHHARGLRADQVLQVRSQADVRSLDGRIDDVRMILVHAGRLYGAVAWAIQMAPAADVEIISRPAVFTTAPPGDRDEDPSATLVLNANPGSWRPLHVGRSLPDRLGRSGRTAKRPRVTAACRPESRRRAAARSGEEPTRSSAGASWPPRDGGRYRPPAVPASVARQLKLRAGPSQESGRRPSPNAAPWPSTCRRESRRGLSGRRSSHACAALGVRRGTSAVARLVRCGRPASAGARLNCCSASRYSPSR